MRPCDDSPRPGHPLDRGGRRREIEACGRRLLIARKRRDFSSLRFWPDCGSRLDTRIRPASPETGSTARKAAHNQGENGKFHGISPFVATRETMQRPCRNQRCQTGRLSESGWFGRNLTDYLITLSISSSTVTGTGAPHWRTHTLGLREQDS
jgi:hypothetical protein